MLEQYNEILTIDDLCEILMIGRNLAYRLLAEKKIRAFRIGKKWEITKASVENYLAENSH